MKYIVLFLLSLTASLSFSNELPIEIQHLSEAIQIKTVSHEDPDKFDAEAFNQFLGFLRTTYPRVFSELEVTVINSYSLVFKWAGSDDSLRPVLIDAHYDVVPVEPGTEDDWDFEPFSGEVKDGYVLGRGAIDNKSPVIAGFEALDRLLASGYQPMRTLYHSLAHDEELLGYEGAVKIVEFFKREGVSFEFMLGEGGIVLNSHPIVPGRTVATIDVAEKGFLTLTLSAEGEGGHSSAPTEDNAMVRVAEAVSKLHRNPFEPKLVSPVSDMLAELGNHVDGFAGFAMRNQWLTEHLLITQMDSSPMTRSLVRTTTAVTIFNSGVKDNVIPQRADAKVNFRLLPGDTQESLISAVEEIIDDPRVKVSAGAASSTPHVSDMDAPGYQKIKNAIEETIPGVLVVPALLMATTDTRHYEEIVDNAYRFQPFFVELENTRGIHGTNEKVNADSFLLSIKLKEAVIKSITTP